MLRILVNVLLISYVFACNDVKITINYAKNCNEGGDNQIATLHDEFKVYVNEKCQLFSSVCYYLQPFKKAMMEMTFYKGKSRLFQEKFDICNRSRKLKETTQIILNGFGWNWSCPNTENNTFCQKDNKIFEFNSFTVAAMRTLLGGASEAVRIRGIITHDNGKSCIEAEAKMKSDIKFKLKSIEDYLGSKNVIKHINQSVVLTDECDIILSACSYVESYKTGLVKVDLMKNDRIIYQMSINICDRKKKRVEMLRAFMAAAPIPNFCPVSSNQTFYYKNMNITRIPSALLKMSSIYLSGFSNSTTQVKTYIYHENERKSCFTAEYEITRLTETG